MERRFVIISTPGDVSSLLTGFGGGGDGPSIDAPAYAWAEVEFADPAAITEPSRSDIRTADDPAEVLRAVQGQDVIVSDMDVARKWLIEPGEKIRSYRLDPSRAAPVADMLREIGAPVGDGLYAMGKESGADLILPRSPAMCDAACAISWIVQLIRFYGERRSTAPRQPAATPRPPRVEESIEVPGDIPGDVGGEMPADGPRGAFRPARRPIHPAAEPAPRRPAAIEPESAPVEPTRAAAPRPQPAAQPPEPAPKPVERAVLPQAANEPTDATALARLAEVFRDLESVSAGMDLAASAGALGLFAAIEGIRTTIAKAVLEHGGASVAASDRDALRALVVAAVAQPEDHQAKAKAQLRSDELMRSLMRGKRP